jgi:type IV pilus assembly protein PilV
MKVRPARTSSAPRQRGFSLLEILVALAVLSIGLLGLAALQTMSLRMGHDSYQRTQATMLAYDMVDRMRANRAALTAGRYDLVTFADNPTGTDCVASACTPDDLANYDIRTWKTVLAAKLSQGQGAISTSGTQRTITVQWRENDVPITLTLVVQI